MSGPLECYFSNLRNSFPGAECFVVMNDDALTTSTRCSSPPTCIPQHQHHAVVLPLKAASPPKQHPSTRRCSLESSCLDDSAPDCPVRKESAENIMEDLAEMYRERRKQRKQDKSKTSTLDKFYGEVVSPTTSSTTGKPTVKRNSLDSKIQQLPTTTNSNFSWPNYGHEDNEKLSSSYSDGVTSARTALFRGMVADVLLDCGGCTPPSPLPTTTSTTTSGASVAEYLDRVEAVVGLSSPIKKTKHSSRRRLSSPPSATRRDTRWSALSKQMALKATSSPVVTTQVLPSRFEQ